MKKDSIIKKIKALMMKTVENGASAEEQTSADNMVASLIKKYSITQEEFDAKQYVILDYSFYCNYSMPIKTIFGPVIAELFDCKVTASRQKINFYGFSEDVELCLFFYVQMKKKCERALKTYKKSEEYLKDVAFYGKGVARSNCDSFRKGFGYRVNRRIRHMYSERKEVMAEDNKYALVVASKVERVEEHMNKNVNVRRDYKNNSITHREQAFNKGDAAGSEVEITKGINK